MSVWDDRVTSWATACYKYTVSGHAIRRYAYKVRRHPSLACMGDAMEKSLCVWKFRNNMLLWYFGPCTRVADLPSRRSLRSVGTNRMVVPTSRLATAKLFRSPARRLGMISRKTWQQNYWPHFVASSRYTCSGSLFLIHTGHQLTVSGGPSSIVADVEARQRLRSSSSSSLIVSRTRLLTVGDRAFPVTAALVWNSLTDHVTSAPSVAVFRSRLKTHLFNISYPCDCTVPAQWL